MSPSDYRNNPPELAARLCSEQGFLVIGSPVQLEVGQIIRNVNPIVTTPLRGARASHRRRIGAATQTHLRTGRLLPEIYADAAHAVLPVQSGGG